MDLGASKNTAQNPFMKASSISIGQINPSINGSMIGNSIPNMSGYNIPKNNIGNNNMFLNSNKGQNQLNNNNPFMNMNNNLNVIINYKYIFIESKKYKF